MSGRRSSVGSEAAVAHLERLQWHHAASPKSSNGEAKTMHSAAKRTLIAGAGLAAAGLFGSLADQGVPQAPGGADRAPGRRLGGCQRHLSARRRHSGHSALQRRAGPDRSRRAAVQRFGHGDSTSEATTLLDATGANPVFSGDFNGAESRFFEAGFLDTLAAEDHLNQLLGVTETASQTAILADFLTTGGPPIPTGADVTL